jgi:hypothetical protein
MIAKARAEAEIDQSGTDPWPTWIKLAPSVM